MTDVAAVASRVDESEGAVPIHRDKRPMIVGAKQEIHTFECLEKIKSLGLQNGTVAFAGGRVSGNYDDVRTMLRPHLVNLCLHHRDNRLKAHSTPELGSKPGCDISILSPYHRDFQPLTTEYHIILKIRLSCVFAHRIRCQPRSFHLTTHPVVNSVPRFDVVVSEANRIVTHIIRNPCKKVSRDGVHIIEIICGIVPLKAVTPVKQNDRFRSVHCPDAVHIAVYGHQRRSHPGARISGVEPGSVHVVGAEKVKFINPVFRTAGNGEQRRKQCRKNCYFSHISHPFLINIYE